MQVIEQLGGMSDERFQEIYEALAKEGYGPLDGEVAKALKFRPHAIKRLPMDKRARTARRLLQRTGNAELAYELFGGFLLKHRKELVTAFLDATGVEHEDGLLNDVERSRPDPERIPAAVAELDAKHDPADVTLYLSVCAEQWPQVPELAELWRARS